MLKWLWSSIVLKVIDVVTTYVIITHYEGTDLNPFILGLIEGHGAVNALVINSVLYGLVIAWLYSKKEPVYLKMVTYCMLLVVMFNITCIAIARLIV
jgi:hypothetical protein